MAAKESTSNPQDQLYLKVELSGGLEILFNGKRVHPLKFPVKDGMGKAVIMKDLIEHLGEVIGKPKQRDLFILDGTVRPGILVLINDADWELEGKDDYELCDGDNILFVSTLHGG